MFEITIKEVTVVEKICGKDWKVIGSGPIDPLNPKGVMKEIYGYTPEVKKLVEETRTILVQQKEQLDVIAVIRAVNNIN